MNRSNFLLAMLVLITFAVACKKSTIDELAFDVRTDSDRYAVGQPVTFYFTGTPQNIAFWSGEQGHNYRYKDRSAEKGIAQTLQFTSAAGAGDQNNNLSVMISADFNNAYNSTGIAAASWHDITGRFKLSPNPVSGAAGGSVASGPTDISDFSTPDNKPVYIAFRYTSASDGLQPRTWTISALSVVNTLADGTVNTVVANLSNAGFKLVDVKNPGLSWSLLPLNNINPTSLSFPASATGAAANEDWAISVPVRLNSVSLSDVSVPVSSLTTLSPPSFFSYTFATPGTYEVTFDAFNADVHDERHLTRTLKLTIE